MSALTRFLMRKKEKQENNPEPQTKLFQTINNIAVFGSFIAVTLFVLGIFKIISMNKYVFGVTATIALVSIGCLMLLPWLRNFEKGINKKTAIVFMCLVALCTILWLVSVYMGIALFDNSKNQSLDTNALLNTLNFVKITLIVSLQFMLVSLITGTIIKYRKNMVVLQIITYISTLFFDLYLTCLLLCVKISPEKGLEISKSISLLTNRFVSVLFFISIIYMLLSSKILKSVDERRIRFAIEENYNLDGTKKEIDAKPSENPTTEERLSNLQSMFDKNLITKEEFEEKRKDILKDL